MQREYSQKYDRDFYIDSNVAKTFDQVSSYEGIPYAALRFENHAYNQKGLFQLSIFNEDPNQIKLLHENMPLHSFPAKRGWLFLSSIKLKNKAFILKCFDKVGERIEHHDFKNASVTLYSFH